MARARPRRGCVELDGPWVANETARSYRPAVAGHFAKRLIFDEPFRNGRISGEMVIRGGGSGEARNWSRFGAFIYRYRDESNYYLAGIRGIGMAFFIAKVERGRICLLEGAGNGDSIAEGKPYPIEVRCIGSRATLFHDGAEVISADDRTFAQGRWGLKTWEAVVEFKRVRLEVDRPACFVIMPFAPKFDDVYGVISRTVKALRFDCVRADERHAPGPIIDDILERIGGADLLVADLTGQNPNVFFEAGYAFASEKPVILVARSVKELSFDVRHLRTIVYEPTIAGYRKLARELGAAIGASGVLAADPPTRES